MRGERSAFGRSFGCAFVPANLFVCVYVLGRTRETNTCVRVAAGIEPWRPVRKEVKRSTTPRRAPCRPADRVAGVALDV